MVLSLLHYANILNNNNFKGSNLNENNTLKDLYEDIADKMYIITSLNKSNTQLQKLDKDFGKLYKLVTTGIRLFKLPSTSGGSIYGGSIYLNISIHQKNTIYQLSTFIIKLFFASLIYKLT